MSCEIDRSDCVIFWSVLIQAIHQEHIFGSAQTSFGAKGFSKLSNGVRHSEKKPWFRPPPLPLPPHQKAPVRPPPLHNSRESPSGGSDPHPTSKCLQGEQTHSRRNRWKPQKWNEAAEEASSVCSIESLQQLHGQLRHGKLHGEPSKPSVPLQCSQQSWTHDHGGDGGSLCWTIIFSCH